jgi:hypothetical protein
MRRSSNSAVVIESGRVMSSRRDDKDKDKSGDQSNHVGGRCECWTILNNFQGGFNSDFDPIPRGGRRGAERRGLEGRRARELMNIRC